MLVLRHRLSLTIMTHQAMIADNRESENLKNQSMVKSEDTSRLADTSGYLGLLAGTN